LVAYQDIFPGIVLDYKRYGGIIITGGYIWRGESKKIEFLEGSRGVFLASGGTEN
jgi:hypothetical protein